MKELRARWRLRWRESCREHGHDPGHWSKLDREVLPPPGDGHTLRPGARQLGLKPGSDDGLKFLEYAAVDARLSLNTQAPLTLPGSRSNAAH